MKGLMDRVDKLLERERELLKQMELNQTELQILRGQIEDCFKRWRVPSGAAATGSTQYGLSAKMEAAKKCAEAAEIPDRAHKASNLYVLITAREGRSAGIYLDYESYGDAVRDPEHV